jgi:hypothetical protein
MAKQYTVSHKLFGEASIETTDSLQERIDNFWKKSDKWHYVVEADKNLIWVSATRKGEHELLIGADWKRTDIDTYSIVVGKAINNE